MGQLGWKVGKSLMIGFWLAVCSIHSPIQIMLSMHITGELVYKTPILYLELENPCLGTITLGILVHYYRQIILCMERLLD